ncbi:MAG: DUF4149 domain-containing protein [Deltaproteobacteria bacterium]|nr:DUF4149 domain-containing protein [Deltaproteobacteria bacterium]
MPGALENILKFIHLLSAAVWIGMLIFFSFFAAPALFKALTREAAGESVGAIFPNYWRVGYAAGAVSLAALLALSFITKAGPSVKIIILAVMLCTTLYSGLVVGARAKEVKAGIKAEADASKKELLRGEFKRVHARSSILNIFVIVLGVVFIFLTAKGLVI